MPPEDPDNSSQPAPVDLSQATPPADAPEANAVAEEVAEDNREITAGKPAPSEKPASEKPTPEKPKAEKPVEKPAAEAPKTEAVAEKAKVKPGGVSSTYTVGSGETFYGVANPVQHESEHP